MKGLFTPACFVTCALALASCGGIKDQAQDVMMTRQSDALFAMANDSSAKKGEAPKKEAKELYDHLNKSYPPGQPISQDTMMRLFKATRPKLEGYRFSTIQPKAHQDGEVGLFFRKVAFPSDGRFADYTMMYEGKGTVAIPLIIADHGDKGYWGRIAYKKYLLSGELGPGTAKLVTVEKPITYEGTEWVVWKYTIGKEERRMFLTMWNDRFMILVSNSGPKLTNPQFFYDAVDLELLNSLK